MDIPPELVDAKHAAEWTLLAIPGVVGIGLGMREEDGELFDELAVRILVDDATAVPPGLPEEIGGVAVCIIEEQVVPCSFPDTARYDPLLGGVMITSPLRGSGTFGAIVEDTTTGEPLGLSCYHVVGDTGQVFPNTIWQPTTPTSGLPVGVPIPASDNIGEVIKVDFPNTPPLPFSPIRAGMTDSAVFRLDAAVNAGRQASRAIAGAGPGLPNLADGVTATAVPEAGVTRVHKRGFQTGPTAGLVIARFQTLQWTPGGPNAFLVDQAVINGDGPVFVDDGDSGSLVLDESQPTALGLLWGKNGPTPGQLIPIGKRGYMSEIAAVESALGVSTVFA